MEALKVAIADDNENMLKVLGQVIGQEQDLSVVGTATNGEDTFHIIKEKEPDVVLLDIIMPQIDGLTVMEKVHKDKEKDAGIYYYQCYRTGQCDRRCI